MHVLGHALWWNAIDARSMFFTFTTAFTDIILFGLFAHYPSTGR